MPTLIVLIGPTGVGKTELSLRLAENFQTHIVSADSRQLYAELSQKSKSLQDIIDKWRPIYLERMEMVKSVSIQKRKRNNKK